MAVPQLIGLRGLQVALRGVSRASHDTGHALDANFAREMRDRAHVTGQPPR